MIDIHFESFSLLYGYSYLWSFAQLFSPYYNLPNFDITKSKHLLSSRFGRKLCRSLTRLNESYSITYWAPKLVFLTHLAFNFAFLLMNHTIQDSVLDSIGVTNKNSLTFKVIRYSPLLRVSKCTDLACCTSIGSIGRLIRSNFQRVVHIIMTMFTENWSATKNLEDWKIFEKTNFFGVSYKLQRNYALLIVFICLPDIVSTIRDIDWLIYHTCAKYPEIAKFLDSLDPGSFFLLRIYFVSIHLSNTVLRYIPFMAMTYATLCTIKHLQILNEQFDQYLCEVMGTNPTNMNRRRRINPNRVNLQPIDANHVWTRNFDEERYSKLNLRVKTKRQTRRIAYPSIAPSDESLLKSLTSLRDFETHLTRLVIFIEELDIRTSLLVYTTCIYNIITILYVSFFLKEIRRYSSMTALSSLGFYIVCRIVPTVALFCAGSLMKRESNILISKQEHLYLEEETQCLIYRQLNGFNCPLMRVFNLLHSVEFNCDNLMKITSSTLIKMIIVTIAAGLVVVQYGEYLIRSQDI